MDLHKWVSYGQMTRSNSRGNFEDLVIRGGKWNEWRVIIFLSRLGFSGYDCLKFFKTDCWSCYKKFVRKQELNEWRKAKHGNAIVCTISLLPWLQWDRGFNQGCGGEGERETAVECTYRCTCVLLFERDNCNYTCTLWGSRASSPLAT